MKTYVNYFLSIAVFIMHRALGDMLCICQCLDCLETLLPQLIIAALKPCSHS